MPDAPPQPVGPGRARTLILALSGAVGLGVSGCSTRTPEALWAEAKGAIEEKRLDRADAAIRSLSRLRPPTPGDRLLRAQLAMTRLQTDEAIAELAEIPDGDLAAGEARLRAGQLELRRDHIRAAESLLLEAARLRPDSIQARRELIFIYGMQLRRRELDLQFRALEGLEPLDFSKVFLWCLSKGLTWEPLEQATDLGRYLDADPTDRASRLALAEVLRRLNRFDEVDAHLATLSEDDPDARAIRVRLALDRGERDKAVALLEAAPRVHADLAMLRGRRAIADGDDETAAAAFRDAYAADPTSRDTIYALANALRRVNDPEAPRYVDLSAKLERIGTLIQRASSPGASSNAPLIRELGAACAEAGQAPQARAWYALAIKLDPLDAEAQRGLYRLKSPKPPAS